MLHAEAAALAQSNGNADAFASAAASSQAIQNCLGTSSNAVAKAEAQAGSGGGGGGNAQAAANAAVSPFFEHRQDMLAFRLIKADKGTAVPHLKECLGISASAMANDEASSQRTAMTYRLGQMSLASFRLLSRQS